MVAVTARPAQLSSLLPAAATRPGRPSRPGALRPPVPFPERRARASAPARRAALAGVFATALAACAVWVQGGAGAAAGRPGDGPLAVPGAGPVQPAAAHVWVVQPGDTVWAIAHTLQPRGDVRPLVDRLDRELGGHALQIGQRLAIP